MTILIFSDTHLTSSFDEKLYLFLKKIIYDADRVIINGDFWEAHFERFDDFLNSAWNRLFSLLKSKKAIYIFGNHDKEKFMDRRLNLFSDVQTKQYLLPINGITYIVGHGDVFFPNGKKEEPSKTFEFLAVSFERIMVSLFGTFFYKVVSAHLNNSIKRNVKKTLKENQFFICGHTHLGEVDKGSGFANCGAIRHGLAQYLLINGNGTITEKVERY